MKFKNKWVLLAPHTKLRQIVYRNEQPRLLDTGPDPLRIWLSARPGYGSAPDIYEMVLGTHTYADGARFQAKWTFADPDPSFTIISLPPVSRDFTSQAVVGSEWVFSRDWSFCGYDGTDKVFTVPAGTVIRVAESKNPMTSFAHWSWQEKALIVDDTPALSMFYLGQRKKLVRFLPLKEVSSYLTLMTPGKVKTYWRLEHTDGTPLVKKNFADLGKVKASARVRFNTVVNRDEDYQNGTAAPYWVEAGDWVETPDISKGLWAVHYDHASKKEIAREDLTTYVVMAKLKSA